MDVRNIRIYEVDRTTSTNDLARNLCGGNEEFVVVAEEQTDNGQGPISNLGGLYFTLCTRMEPLLDLKAAAAVAQTLDDLGVESSIQWPSVITVDNKILCDIVMEQVGDKALVAMAMNMEYSPEDKGTCITTVLGRPIQSKTIMNGILARMELMDDVMDSYKQYTSVIGKKVGFESGGKKGTGKVESIDEEGNLVLQDGKRVRSAQVLPVRRRKVTSSPSP